MDQASAISALERIVDGNGTAVLANIDQEGLPRTRWMTPCVLRDQQGSLFALTSADFDKRAQIGANGHVEWLVTGANREEIVRVRGNALVVDNPRLKAEIVEALGARLAMFWRVSPDPDRLVVLETVITEISYYRPASGEKSRVAFG